MKTKVVHLNKDDYDVLIDRRTVFGNKYYMLYNSDRERERVIKEHRIWFLNEVFMNKIFRNKVLLLKGKTLGCWCKPKACHGDIIADWVNEYAT